MSIAKNLQLSFFGLLSATLMSAPAFAQNAASVTQLSGQTADQIGVGNTAVQGSLQTADVNQIGSPHFPSINGANVVQGSNQYAGQYGYGNTAVQGNASTATVNQSPSTTYPYPVYPSYPYPGYPTSTSVNGASVLQGSGQTASQVGGFNSAVQGNAADANVQQH